MIHRTRITEEVKKAVVAMKGEGASHREVMTKLKISEDSIRAIMHAERDGLPLWGTHQAEPRWNAEQDRAILRMKAEKFSFRQIAQHVCRSVPQTSGRYYRLMGKKKTKPKGDPKIKPDTVVAAIEPIIVVSGSTLPSIGFDLPPGSGVANVGLRKCCSWPLWSDKPTHLYCDGERLSGSPYCEQHQSVARGTRPEMRREAAA